MGGQLTFGPIVVRYDDRVLEPRPWTILQAAWAAEVATEVPEGPLLELCCGAGHIGQAAARWAGRRLVQVDRDPDACALAEENARANGLADSVEVRCGDLEASLDGGERFPLILADPPYLPSRDAAQWPQDPPGAVDGGSDGLAVSRACLRLSAQHLLPAGGVLLQCHGAQQVDRLEATLGELGLVVIEVRVEDDERAVAHLRAG